MAVADILAVRTTIGAAANGIGVGNFLLPSFHASNRLSLIDSYAKALSSSSRSARVLQISSACSNAVDAVAAPPLRLNICRVPRRSLVSRKPRTKRRLSGDDDSENPGDEGLFDSGGGPFDDGGFGGSGGGWIYNRFGEGRDGRDDGDESSSSSWDPVFFFVYQVVSWITLLKCLEFAFKKIVRWAANGIVGAAIDKGHRKLGGKEIHHFRDLDW